MSVPDPVSVGFTAAEEAAWYARLPTMFGAAAALFTDAAGRVLLVKPNYRDHWSLPGRDPRTRRAAPRGLPP